MALELGRREFGWDASPHLREGEEFGRCFFVGPTGGRSRLTGSLLRAN